MRTSLFSALLGLALLTSAADPCTLVVTARPGDTCASLAEVSGITVSQFLRANPTITTCSALVSGTKYCVDPNYVASSTSRAAPAATSTPTPSKPLDVTTDGHCSGSLTCLGSAFGDCCSKHGWCGSSADHCGEGCQAVFGRCNSSGGGETTSQPPVGGVSTVYVTTTTTQIVRTTVTAKENGGVATTTSTVVVTSTQNSLRLISSTITTIRTITITDAKMCSSTRSLAPGGIQTVTEIGGGGGSFGLIPRAKETGIGGDAREVEEEMKRRYPAPTQPGLVPDCQTFYRVKGDDSCEGIVERHAGAFGMRELYAWNQQLTGDCQGLWLGHWICVGV